MHFGLPAYFDFRNNSLFGNIPDTWDEGNIIQSFLISYNYFSGRLPESLAKASSLRKLHVSGNSITGSIPTSYYQMEKLTDLHLSGNKLGGELPQTAEPFYDGLKEFAINDNNFEGRFPAENFEPIPVLSK